jgi:hypothetical protein
MNIDMSNDYLNNINKYSGFLEGSNSNRNKLEKMRKNITNYIKSKDEKQLEKGHLSTYRPIPKASFDTIFMNVNQIHHIYISSNVDRFIFEMNDNTRYVYYIDNKDEYRKMEQLMKVIPSKHKAIIINDVHNIMDDPFGYLYCEKK